MQAEDGIRDLVRSRGLGDVYKRQLLDGFITPEERRMDEEREREEFKRKSGGTYNITNLSLIHI